jgi:glycerol-3-phosphate dehydrogenase (NAD(P)+)
MRDRVMIDHIAVLGAGAWGTALANVAARAGRRVTLWARDADAAERIDRTRQSPRLPGVMLDERIVLTASLAQAAAADAVLAVVPAQAMRAVLTAFASHVRPATPLICCAKGIESKTGRFMTEVMADCVPAALPAVLSGPSFAADVAQGLPTAVTLAAADESLAASLAAALVSPAFRPYHSTDLRGVEIGGAAKNVLAIAAGIVVGRGLGASAAAALTTRGFAELFRFGEAFGARPQTLTGLSGLGDLILTCASAQSRNFAHGVMLGEGGGGKDTKLAEGVYTAAALVRLAQNRGVDMPIASDVAAVIAGEMSIEAAIESLMARPLRAEA